MNRYEQIIFACGFSEEMERYLIGCKLNDYNIPRCATPTKVVRILKGESKEDL